MLNAIELIYNNKGIPEVIKEGKGKLRIVNTAFTSKYCPQKIK